MIQPVIAGQAPSARSAKKFNEVISAVNSLENLVIIITDQAGIPIQGATGKITPAGDGKSAHLTLKLPTFLAQVGVIDTTNNNSCTTQQVTFIGSP